MLYIFLSLLRINNDSVGAVNVRAIHDRLQMSLLKHIFHANDVAQTTNISLFFRFYERSIIFVKKLNKFAFFSITFLIILHSNFFYFIYLI